MNFIYKKWLPSAINGLFLFFISITLIGAFRSDNLKISTLTNHFFLILLIAILAIVVLLFSKHAKKWIDKYLFGVKKIFFGKYRINYRHLFYFWLLFTSVYLN